MNQTEHSPTSLIPSEPFPGIEPVDGWQLRVFDEWDSDGFSTAGYVARRGNEERSLRVCRFRFTPSQDRFAWLVRAGFPASPNIGPWDDTDIEMRIAVPEMAA
jgi:hypothetical protein